MPNRTSASFARLRTVTTIAAISAALMLGGCAGVGGLSKSALTDTPPPGATAQAEEAVPGSELEKAVDYWGKAYAKNPRDLNAALAYAQNLKAMGQKGQALSVLQQASMFHSSDRKLASEYGRLALEMDQIQVAQSLLEVADDPARPDWRVISARGTVLAKQGKYSEAIPFYERAQTLSANQPSVLNNLALAYTMSGEPQKAEQLLRQANQTAGADPKVRPNLALVLGLQGKYDESKQTAAPDSASDADYLRRMVKLDPKTTPTAAPATQIAAGKPAAPNLKPSRGTDVATGSWEGRVADASAEPSPQLRPSAD